MKLVKCYDASCRNDVIQQSWNVMSQIYLMMSSYIFSLPTQFSREPTLTVTLRVVILFVRSYNSRDLCRQSEVFMELQHKTLLCCGEVGKLVGRTRLRAAVLPYSYGYHAWDYFLQNSFAQVLHFYRTLLKQGCGSRIDKAKGKKGACKKCGFSSFSQLTCSAC